MLTAPVDSFSFFEVIWLVCVFKKYVPFTDAVPQITYEPFAEYVR